MSEARGRRRRVFVHLVVPYLAVAVRWRVGRVTFLPPRRLLYRLERHQQSTDRWPRALDNWVRGSLSDQPVSTVEVPTWSRGLKSSQIEDETFADARDTARDSIAAVRLFARARSRMNTDRQTFGLIVDVGEARREDRWVSDAAGRFVSRGAAMHGSLAPWNFTRRDIAEISSDPRFNYVDTALGTPEEQRTDWQRRVVLAVRTLGAALPTDRPGTRIVMAATSIEALLGDRFEHGSPATGAHRLAQRAAFAWCGTDLADPHGQAPARPACDFLRATGDRDLARRAAALRAEGGHLVCSYYGSMRALSDDRNEAVHGSETRFGDKAAASHVHEVSGVILAVVAWVVDHQATTFAEYLAAIDALPVPVEVAARATPSRIV